MYTYEESLRDSIEYFNNDELAGKVFVDKYALRNKGNDLFHENTPKDMHRRISVNIVLISSSKQLQQSGRNQ